MKYFLCIDGESQILSQGLNPRIAAWYQVANINASKGYTNYTSEHQLFDAQPGYMNTPADVHIVATQDIDVRSQLMRASLDRFFDKFKQHSKKTVPALKREKIAHGLETLAYALQHGSITGPKLRKAAISIGQHTNDTPPYSFPGDEATTIDIRRIFSLSKWTMSDNQLANFEKHLPDLIDDCIREGCSNDVLMDQLRIVKSDDRFSRDNLYISQRYPIIFSHDKEVARFSVRISILNQNITPFHLHLCIRFNISNGNKTTIPTCVSKGLNLS